MHKLFGMIAAVMLGLMLFSPAAAAHCWWHGHRVNCWHHRYHHHVYYRPYAYSAPHFYPYAYYPAPYYRAPYFCAPFWPLCFY